MGYKIVDSFLPTPVADGLENVLFSGDFPWFFLEDVTYASTAFDGEKIPAFGHTFCKDGVPNSDFYKHVINVPFLGHERIPPSYVDRAVTFLQLPTAHTSKQNNVHVDSFKPHIVLLYYVCDSDGDTLFYKDDEVVESVTPKKNRAVIFEGSIYHASSTPTKNKRCVINFNLIPY